MRLIDKDDREACDHPRPHVRTFKQDTSRIALRISFKTERPLFPYREPDPKAFAQSLGAKERLLRIYFLAEARYRGELTKEVPWTGRVAWAGLVDGSCEYIGGRARLGATSRRNTCSALAPLKNTCVMLGR